MRRSLRALLTGLVLAGSGTAGCQGCIPINVKTAVGEQHPTEGTVAAPVQNGLDDTARNRYYHADEGIQYIALDVLLSLDRPIDRTDGNDQFTGATIGLYDELFLAKPERLGLYQLPEYEQVASGGERVPVGITVSADRAYLPMAGINCATCHTGLMIATGPGGVTKRAIIDGAPSLFAIDRFLGELVFAMLSTSLSPAELDKVWARLQPRIDARLAQLGGAAIPAAQKAQETEAVGTVEASPEYGQLQAAARADDRLSNPAALVQAAKALQSKLQQVNPAPPSRLGGAAAGIGFGAQPKPGDLSTKLRLLGYLLNRIIWFLDSTSHSPPSGASTGLGRSNPWGVTKNLLADELYQMHNAWQAHPGGPMSTPYIWRFSTYRDIFWTGVTNSMVERNLAQGIALFADVDWNGGTFETTVSIKKLDGIVKDAATIKAPTWPTQLFPPADAKKSEEGKAIFRDHCLDCHSPWPAKDAPGLSLLKYCDVGTDTSYRDGQVEKIGGRDLFKDVLTPFMKQVKQKVYARDGITGQEGTYEPNRLPVVWRGPLQNAFVAKPLDGVWASAPYLHNGTVPSIADLLDPAAKRPTHFWVGILRYDAAKLGFVSPDKLDKQSPDDLYYLSDVTTRPDDTVGNANRGHEYAVADKEALIEFLKVYDDKTFPGFAGDCTSADCKGHCWALTASP